MAKKLLIGLLIINVSIGLICWNFLHDPQAGLKIFRLTTHLIGKPRDTNPFARYDIIGGDLDDTLMIYYDPPEGYSGEWRIWYKNGQTALLKHYKHGVLNGPLIAWDREGYVICYANILDNKPHGFEFEWYSGSTTAKGFGEYNRGHLNGVSKSWYRNGNIESTGEFIMDKKHGPFLRFDEKGNLEEKRNFSHGVDLDVPKFDESK